MNIQDRVNLYKKLYTASEAPTAVKKYLDKIITINGELDVLEALRELNTDLSDPLSSINPGYNSLGKG